MAMTASEKQFTGKHMLASIVGFFAVIFAVNFTMAYLANSTWSGLVAANGYVASQSFDKDLARQRQQEALGWKVALSHDAERIRITFMDAAMNKIDGLAITGKLERPVTDRQDQLLTFTSIGSGVYSAPASLSPGVWEVEIEAKGDSAPGYRKTFRFIAKG